MLFSMFLAFFVPCTGMAIVFIIYLFLLYCTARLSSSRRAAAKTVDEKGLSTSDLDKLPKVTGKELVLGTECAVCLEEIESNEAARVVPVCNHGFHLQCADLWLLKHPVCPVCRAKLGPEFFIISSQNPC